MAGVANTVAGHTSSIACLVKTVAGHPFIVDHLANTVTGLASSVAQDRKSVV